MQENNDLVLFIENTYRHFSFKWCNKLLEKCLQKKRQMRSVVKFFFKMKKNLIEKSFSLCYFYKQSTNVFAIHSCLLSNQFSSTTILLVINIQLNDDWVMWHVDLILLYGGSSLFTVNQFQIGFFVQISLMIVQLFNLLTVQIWKIRLPITFQSHNFQRLTTLFPSRWIFTIGQFMFYIWIANQNHQVSWFKRNVLGSQWPLITNIIITINLIFPFLFYVLNHLLNKQKIENGRMIDFLLNLLTIN